MKDNSNYFKYNPENNEEIKTISAFYSTPSEKHPERNEDTVLVNDDKKLYGVFDGVGGGPAGDLASKIASEYINGQADNLDKVVVVEDLQIEMIKIFNGANKAVYNKGLNNFRTANMSTTATVVKFCHDKRGENFAVVANVGDSRVYVVSDGKLSQITIDDNILNGADTFKQHEKNEISRKLDNVKTREEIESEPIIDGFFKLRNVITKFLGENDDITPRINATKIKKGDKIIISSDGIHDNLTFDELEKIVIDGGSNDYIAQKIQSAAIERSRELPENNIRAKKDDISVVCIEVI